MRTKERERNSDNHSASEDASGGGSTSNEGLHIAKPEDVTAGGSVEKLKSENAQLKQELQRMYMRLRFYTSKLDAIGHVVNNPEPKF